LTVHQFMASLLGLLLLAGVALYFMTPEERAWLSRGLDNAIRNAIRAVTKGSSSDEPFDELLRGRTACTIVTPVLVALNTLVFTFMLVSPGALDDVQTLVGWGANFAPRTTNGEWWRLVSAMFVHSGFLHLLATIAALLPLGLVLERAVGRRTFACVYFTAGTLASVVSLWTTPSMSVTLGASGAVFGLYGLMLASLAWGFIGGDLPSRSPQSISVPAITRNRIAAAAGVFLLYNLVTDDLGMASELTGLAAGFAAGVLLARDVVHEKPQVRRAVLAMAPMILIAAASAIPLHQINDVRPEIVRITTVEQQTAAAYDAAVAKFKHRRISAEALAELIDRTIVPELQAARTRLKAVPGVPREQAPLVTAAEQYFALREESWRRRAEGLLRLDDTALRAAERAERAALEAFEKMQRSS
jgi:rhomboid protease GluP